MTQETDQERDRRIRREILTDAYTGDEQAISWVYHLEREMFVLVEWMDREFGVPLSQLEVLDGDQDTRNAVADWHYWNGDGGRLG